MQTQAVFTFLIALAARRAAASHRPFSCLNHRHHVTPSQPLTPLQAVAVKAAIGGDVVMTLSNEVNLAFLDVFLKSAAAARVHNVVVACLDRKTYDWCTQSHGYCHLRDNLEMPAMNGRHPREIVSAKKYVLIHEVLQTGVNVLLSDTDVVLLSNPFPSLPSSVDVAAMTDGWNEATVQGDTIAFDDPPLPPPWYYRRVFLNSGFFYVKSSTQTLASFQAIADRLSRETMWDQDAFNQELWKVTVSPVHAAHHHDALVVSILDWTVFSNSKVYASHNASESYCPKVVHANYHGCEGNCNKKMHVLTSAQQNYVTKSCHLI